MQYEGVVDVFQTVRTLRTQRPAMVQTEVNCNDKIEGGDCSLEHAFIQGSRPKCLIVSFLGPISVLLPSSSRILIII